MRFADQPFFGLLVAAAFVWLSPISADAAVTKGAVLACRDQAVFRTLTQPRGKMDPKAVAAMEAAKLSASECIRVAGGATLAIDLRSPPMMCVRRVGDLDCFWTQAASIDEFPAQAGHVGRPGASGGRKRRR